jgi:hypothetical protein
MIINVENCSRKSRVVKGRFTAGTGPVLLPSCPGHAGFFGACEWKKTVASPAQRGIATVLNEQAPKYRRASFTGMT